MPFALLLKANANPNAQKHNGATPLHVSSLTGHADVVSLLLKANANPNLQDNSNVSALFSLNFCRANVDIVTLLLNANC